MAIGAALGIPFQHRVGGAAFPGYAPVPGFIWYGTSNPSLIDPNTAVDKVGVLDDVKYVDNPCLEFTGAETLAVPGLVAGDSVVPFVNEGDLGSEEITNGDFEGGATGWTEIGESYIENGVGIVYSSIGSWSALSQSIIDQGKTYRITLDVLTLEGQVCVQYGDGATKHLLSVGTNDITAVADGAGASLYIGRYTASPFEATIDNVSVRELKDTDYALPTAGTDEVTYTAGHAYGLLINNELTYTFAENSGTTVYDITGSGNHATLSTDTVRATDDDAPAWFIRDGGGIGPEYSEFNGVDDHLIMSLSAVSSDLYVKLMPQIIGTDYLYDFRESGGTDFMYLTGGEVYTQDGLIDSYVNGTLLELTLSVTPSSADNYLMARNNLSGFFSGSIYRFTIGNISLIPTDSNAMYDTVSETLFPNLGNGNLTAQGGEFIPALSTNPITESDVLGEEEVTNGGFDTDTDWTKGTGTTISGGIANVNEAAYAFFLTQTINPIAGSTYIITADITGGDDFYFRIGGVSSPVLVGDGTVSVTITTTAINQELQIRAGASGFTGSIDNISVKEIIVSEDTYDAYVAGVTSQAADNNALTCEPQTQQNGSPSKHMATDFGMVPTLVTPWGDAAQGAEVNGKPSYEVFELGAELVVNGTFDTDTDWTKNIGWSINTTAKRAECDGSQASSASIFQSAIESGKEYVAEYDLVVSAGTAETLIGGSYLGEAYSTSQHVEVQFTSTGTAFGVRGNTSFTGSVDNVSVREVTANYTISNDGAQWNVVNELTSETFSAVYASTFPPTTGWSVGSLGSAAPTMGYDGSVWVSEGVYGDELVVNGDFSSWVGNDPDWWIKNIPSETASVFVENVGNAARCFSSAGSSVGLKTADVLTIGKTYDCEFDITDITGTMRIYGASTLETFTTTGAKHSVFVADSTDVRFISSGSADFTFDNVSVREVIEAPYEFRRISYADWSVHPNGSGATWLQWAKRGADDRCHLIKIAVYDNGRGFTVPETEKNEKWAVAFTGTCES